MSRIATTFADLRARSEKALVAFVTAGDPLADRTADVIAALAEGGADVVELGIPFSDPLADGPAIQASYQRALRAGITPPRILDVVREARRRTNVPLVLMGAWNPVMQYGPERFARDAVDAGVDGTILTDLTPEEAGKWKELSDAAGLDTIFLLAPTSTPARMALVGGMTTGFVYCVSRTGVTGYTDAVPDDLPPLIARIRAHTDKPVCVGFGISRPEHVATVCRRTDADGAVVGTALVDLLHRERDSERLLDRARDFVATLKAETSGQWSVAGGQWSDAGDGRSLSSREAEEGSAQAPLATDHRPPTTAPKERP